MHRLLDEEKVRKGARGKERLFPGPKEYFNKNNPYVIEVDPERVGSLKK
jgi:hypothetical protein